MAGQAVHGNPLAVQDLQPQRQRGHGRVQVGPHEAGQGEVAVRAAQQKGPPGVKVGHPFAGIVVHRHQAPAVRRALQRKVEQPGEQLPLVGPGAAEPGGLGQQVHPGVQVAGAVVAVDHRHRRAVRRGDQVDLGVHAGKRAFQHHHRKNAGAGAHVAGAGGHAVGGGHAGAGVPLRRAEGHAGLQGAGGVQQPGALGRQGAGRRPGGQHPGQQRRQVHRAAPGGGQVVEPGQQIGVIVAGGAVDGEHARSVPDAQHPAAGELPVDIAGQRVDAVQPGQVGFPVQDGLVEMGHAPPLGNVEAEGFGQGFGRPAGGGVAPGAEGHQQRPALVKGQVAVHHGRNAQAAHGGQRGAVAGAHVGGQGGPGRLQPGPDGGFRIGPDAVFQPVFPGIVPLGQRGVVGAHQHRLDAGGAELDAKGASFRTKG